MHKDCIVYLLSPSIIFFQNADNFLSFSLQIDLSGFIDKSGCSCLNESDDNTFMNAFKKGAAYLESDCDEQVGSRHTLGVHGQKIFIPINGFCPLVVGEGLA